MQSTPTLLVYARAPRPGSTKTRLAADIGAAAAAAVYELLLRDALDETAALPASMRIVIEVPDPADVPWFQRAYPRLDIRLQAGGDIGERMRHSFRRCFEGGGNPVILAGTDVPDFSAGVILTALRDLADHDAVLGPAADGGYVLVGMRTFIPELFADIPWSTGDVCSRTIERLRDCGQSFTVLDTVADIDTAADLTQWLVRGRKPALRQAIERILARSGAEGSSRETSSSH